MAMDSNSATVSPKLNTFCYKLLGHGVLSQLQKNNYDTHMFVKELFYGLISVTPTNAFSRVVTQEVRARVL